MLRFKQGCPTPEFHSALYRKVMIVRLWKMPEPFECESEEGEIDSGGAGDFLAEDEYGGFYPISAEFHSDNYVLAE